ncbi:hypothetical protein BGW42_007798 [Actinomortierella wolfii]|nr:hypothetical protein BGW42_007798 [Actinomortierella wolfii]
MAPTQFFALAAAAVLALSASVVSAIPSGKYFVTGDGGYVGRDLFEDRSGGPKELFLIQNPRKGHTVWDIEDLGSGRHKITVGGGVLANLGGELFAKLNRNANDTWAIVPVGRRGTYRIMPYGQGQIGIVSPKNFDDVVKVDRNPTVWTVERTENAIIFPEKK